MPPKAKNIRNVQNIRNVCWRALEIQQGSDELLIWAEGIKMVVQGQTGNVWLRHKKDGTPGCK